jgi:nitroreductase
MPLIAEHAAMRELCAPSRRESRKPTARAGPPKSESTPVVRSAPDKILADRRSVRQFAGRPVPAALLADACQNAMRIERAYWPAEVHGDAGLRLAVATARVDGLATGVHTFSVATAEFGYLADAALVGELQQEYANAPALVLVCAEHVRDRDVLPRSSYQSMVVRAGTLGYAVLLNAMAAGLCGCPFGRAMSQVPSTLSARYARPVHHLFTIAIGWPTEAEPSQPSTG